MIKYTSVRNIIDNDVIFDDCKNFLVSMEHNLEPGQIDHVTVFCLSPFDAVEIAKDWLLNRLYAHVSKDRHNLIKQITITEITLDALIGDY